MNILLSAKGTNVTAWRASEEFAGAYRQVLLDRAASDRCGGVETVFSDASAALDTAVSAHKTLLQRMERMIHDVAATPPTGRKEVTIAFYSDLYRHFSLFRSPTAFYQLSMAFLRQTSAAIFTQAAEQLGAHAAHLPEMALIAVGPAGRAEYSPFCPLQLLLLHGEVAASQSGTIGLFCDTLHGGFEAAGLAIDPVVTPRNDRWRGTLTEWQRRCEDGLQPQRTEDLIDLCRLVDLYPLHPAEGFPLELTRTSCVALSGNRAALENLVARMTSLSNGLGLMGRLKLERSGSGRGMFNLLGHGLQPLSAALSALALIKGSQAVGTCDRIRELLKRRDLDVELAERMLATWHSLNDLRLGREQSLHIDQHTGLSLFLNPNELTDEQLQSLKEALESVAIIQRHVDIIFSERGE